MKTELPIQDEIRLELGSRSDIRLFRQDNGHAWQGKVTKLADGSIHIQNPRRVVYGMGKGTSDLIGWTMRNGIAVFTAIEVKRPRGGRRSEAQTKFIEAVRRFGGLAGFARSVGEAEEIVRG